MMHQEAIFQGVTALNRPVLELRVIHEQLIETIGWIDSNAVKMVTCMDRFSEVNGEPGYRAIQASVRDTFSIR